MEILQLRYFFESANNQSFSKTAENIWSRYRQYLPQ